ncbi:hypothetical protein Tco_0530738 [Tanacetum coccineum]
MGDFNVTMNAAEHSSGSSGKTVDMVEFNDAINIFEIEDICSSGFHFEWTKSLKNPQCKTLKKLDRITKYLQCYISRMASQKRKALSDLVLGMCRGRKRKNTRRFEAKTKKELKLNASRHMFTVLAITRSYELRLTRF